MRHEVARFEWTHRKEVGWCRLCSPGLVLDARPHPDVRCRQRRGAKLRGMPKGSCSIWGLQAGEDRTGERE